MPIRYYSRTARQYLVESLASYPVVVLTGARQAGKSTLLRNALPDWRMVSLEDPDLREFAQSDPRGFLRQHAAPLIVDEVQRVPALFSYIQTMVDVDRRMGRYVLSGSQQFSLLAGITQSLAGRAALIELHPMRLKELADAGISPASLDTLLHAGAYPAVYERGLVDRAEAVARYYADYVQSYLERDVRGLTAVHDLGTFQRFLRLAAARTGQLLNLNALASDCGISQPTAAAWMNVLEASYVVRRIAPYHRNFGKRLVKAPKLLPSVHPLWRATTSASSGLPRAAGSPRRSSVSIAMKWLLPAPKLPCRYAPLLERESIAPLTMPSAWSKHLANCGVTT